jgi:hypothetical protein
MTKALKFIAVGIGFYVLLVAIACVAWLIAGTLVWLFNA